MVYENFNWASSPLNSFNFALFMSFSYLGACLLHRTIFLNDPPEFSIWKYFKSFVPLHNLVLSLGSLVMFIGCLREVVVRSYKEGSAEWLLCESSDTTSNGPLWFWSYLYYLSKYYELLDTLLQILRGRYPPHYFLHAYHHGAVILMSWVWINYSASMQFIGILFNTAVHVVMYYYFYLKSHNIEPKWKKFVTLFQIVQFITSVVCFIATMYLVHGLKKDCKGIRILYGSIFFNITLLFGFIKVLFTSKPRHISVLDVKDSIKVSKERLKNK